MKKKVSQKNTDLRNINRAILCVYFIVFALVVAKVIAVNKLAIDGSKLNESEQRALILSEENAVFKGKIAKLSSLSRISSEALKLGFIQSKSVVHFTLDVPIALR